MPDGTRRVFLSHASADKGLIKPLALALIARGYGVFIDRPEELGWTFEFCRENNVSFLMGGDFGAQLRQAVASADAILGCLSRNLSDARHIWKEELLVGEHLNKLVLCRIDDVTLSDFDDVDTGSVQLERLQSRGLTLTVADPRDPVPQNVVDALLGDASFSFILHEIERLSGRAPHQTQSTSVDERGGQPLQSDPSRTKQPMVRMSYPNDDGVEQSLPFVVKVMSDLGCYDDLLPLYEREFETVDRHSFDEYLSGTRPTLRIRVRNMLTGEGDLAVELVVTRLEDFEPLGIVQQHPALRALWDGRQSMARLLALIDGKPEAEAFLNEVLLDGRTVEAVVEAAEAADAYREDDESPPLFVPSEETKSVADLFDVLDSRFRPRSESAQFDLHRAFSALCGFVLADPMLASDNIGDTLVRMTAELDHKLTEQTNEILHHPDFQQLESAWRGLSLLLDEAAKYAGSKVAVMNASKRELLNDLRKYAGSNWTRSPLYRRLYDDGYGTLGGEPPSILIGDYYFDHSAPDVDLLRNLSKLAAATHAPFLSGANPRLLQMESWIELPNPTYLNRIFEAPEYAAWRALRDNPDSRFVGLICPRFMARAPYEADERRDEFVFSEETGEGNPDHFCWSNAAYLLAANVLRANAKHGWCATIVGGESRQTANSLPVVQIRNERGSLNQICPTEIAITIQRERELADVGLTPLIYERNSTRASLLSAPSLYNAPFAGPLNDTENLAAHQFQHVLPAARVVQYLRCMIRDRGSRFADVGDLKIELNKWLEGYVDRSDLPRTDPARARRPLSAAVISIDEAPSGSDLHLARVDLTPAYQLRDTQTPVRLTFDFTM